MKELLQEWLQTEGPWKGEPLGDEIILFNYKGYRFFLYRHLSLGQWNGYIEIPNALLNEEMEDYLEREFHGGITFQNDGQDFYLKDHVVLGFDTAHAGQDEVPFTCFLYKKIGMHDVLCSECKIWNNSKFYKNRTYKTFEWTKKECERLIDNIIDKLKEKNE